jgi:CheY-like chemotaxis protein
MDGAVNNVLVAEDDAISQIVARKFLEALGCNVEMAGDGREAIEMARKKTYDIVFMDARMPDMDGYEATAEIRRGETGGRVPIIAMTADASPGAQEKCRAAGMDDYIAKPLDLAAMRALLERWGKAQ